MNKEEFKTKANEAIDEVVKKITDFRHKLESDIKEKAEQKKQEEDKKDSESELEAGIADFKAKANDSMVKISKEMEEFKKKLDVSYEEALKDIDKTKADLGIKYAKLKQEADKAIKELEGKKDTFDKNNAKPETAKEKRWEEVKQAFSSASKSFKEGFDKLDTLFT